MGRTKDRKKAISCSPVTTPKGLRGVGHSAAGWPPRVESGLGLSPKRGAPRLAQMIESSPAETAVKTPLIFFDRKELDRLLRLYGRMVAQGDWRDYAINGGRDAATFAVFRRSGETPLYMIEKRPSLARRQGAFSVIAHGGVVVRRGHELEQVLKVFDTRKFRVVE
jgi:hypothetical protein